MPDILRLRIHPLAPGLDMSATMGELVEVPSDLTLARLAELLHHLQGTAPAPERIFSRPDLLPFEDEEHTTVDQVFSGGRCLLEYDVVAGDISSSRNVWLERRLQADPQALYPRRIGPQPPHAPIEDELPDARPVEPSGEPRWRWGATATPQRWRSLRNIAEKMLPPAGPDTDDEAAAQIGEAFLQDVRWALGEFMASADSLSPASLTLLTGLFHEAPGLLEDVLQPLSSYPSPWGDRRPVRAVQLVAAVGRPEPVQALVGVLEAAESLEPLLDELMPWLLTLAGSQPDAVIAAIERDPRDDVRVSLLEALLDANLGDPRVEELFESALEKVDDADALAVLGMLAIDHGTIAALPIVRRRFLELPLEPGEGDLPYAHHVHLAWAIEHLAGSFDPPEIDRLRALEPLARTHPYWDRISL